MNVPELVTSPNVELSGLSPLGEAGANPLLTTNEGATPLMAAAGVGIWRAGENPGNPEEALAAGKLAVAPAPSPSAVAMGMR